MRLLGYAGYRNVRVGVIALAAVICGSPLRAQNGAQNGAETHGAKTIQAYRTEEPILVDGMLDETAWEAAPVSTGLIQKEPFEGQPASERTDIRVVYTATTLYIGVYCADSDPAGILASERRRDGDLSGDDTVSVVLDTFHDHRNAFAFATNPLGTQWDALETDEGRSENRTWDERWEVSTQRHEGGWTAEFAIPFKSVRVPETSNGMTWGIDFERKIRRKNETAYLVNYRRGFQMTAMSHAGHLAGLSDIETGLRLRIKPYVTAGFNHSTDRAASDICNSDDPQNGSLTGGIRCNASDVGIEVLKYRITPSLTADMTWNTDFAQADVDELQVNLDRFPLLYPEKREFFQEGAGIFDFGSAGAATTSMQLFHSRQIGFSPRRRPVPIVGGGRVTGKVPGFTLGLMNVQTEALPIENIPASNYSVARVKRDVFSRSTVGAYFLNRESGGSGDYNRVYGMDAAFTFHRYFTVDGFFARSAVPSEDSKWVYNVNSAWNSDQFLLGVDWLSIDPGFRDDLGFIRRSDIHRLGPRIAWRPRPNLPWVRQTEFILTWDYTMDSDNNVLRRTDKYGINVFFQDGGQLRVIPFDYELDRVDEDFEISDGVLVPAGTYQWNVYVLRYSFSPKRRFSGTLDFSHRYGFYGGNMYKFQLTPVLKVSRQFSVETNYEIDNASLPVQPGFKGDFLQHIVNVSVNYSLNNQWLTSSTIQWDNIGDFFGFHFRLNYIFRPGDDFFLIYNEGRQVGGAEDNVTDRTLKAKLTYSFDF
jgi:hypothetical protein